MKYYPRIYNWSLISGVLSVLLGCQSFFVPTKPSISESPEVAQKPEDIIDELMHISEHFEDAMLAKQFDAARLLLNNAEHLLATATPLTRAHPDFDDLSVRMHNNHIKLDKAQEADRLQRRNAQIDSLIDEGEQAMHQSEQLLLQIDPSPAQSLKLQRINELLSSLEDLGARGKTFVDEPRYVKHVQALHLTIGNLEHAQTQLNLQLQATQQVTPLIDAAIAALRIAQGATDDQSQQIAYQRVMQNFTNCANVLQGFMNQTSSAKNLQINTTLGQLSILQTQQKCLSASAQAKTYLPTQQPAPILPHNP